MAAKSPDQNGIWTPYKELLAVVELVVGHNKVEYLSDLESHLTRYRPIIISLLENPEKNTKQREELKKAPKDGIQLEGDSSPTKFSESFVQEALLLSDALNLSEFLCVDLLLSAEQQLANFPGFSRGLVAALLYHDGRRCLLSAIKLLLTAREGISWTLELDEQISELINGFAQKFFNDGLLTRLLLKLREINVQTELAKLEQSKAVGDAKHKKQLTDLITEQRHLLSDCLFCWACQSPLGKKECCELIDFLKDCTPASSDGTFDHVTLKIVMTLLISWGTSGYEALAEDTSAAESISLPVFKDSNFLSDLHHNIIRPDSHGWKTPSIKTILQFAWAIFLRVVSQFQQLDCYEEIFEEDEELLNVAIEADAISHFKSCIVSADIFPNEEYIIKTIHTLITTLIVKYPLKTKDLRNRGDENARILQAHVAENVEPPKGLRHDFQDLMSLIGDLYKNDPLGLELSAEYWCPNEPFGSMFSPKPLSVYRQSLVQKQIMLNKFVRLAGDLIPQSMFTAYIKMLTGLSSNPQAAQYCFNLLSSDGSIGRATTSSASWDHFFHSFKQYYASMKQDVSSADHLSHMHHHQTISPDEQTALESVLELIKTVAEQSESVRIALCENQSWLPVACFFGLIGCPVPSTLKAALLEALAAFAKSPEISTTLWQSLEATQILSTVKQGQTGSQAAGIKVELEEIEARNETYPQTRAFLKLINRLTDITLPTTLGAGYRVPGFTPYLEFLRDNVFLRFMGRAYQDAAEKWVVASEVLEIFVKILSSYNPLRENVGEQEVQIQGVNFGRASQPPGYEIMVHLLNDTPMFRLVMNIIDTLGKELEESIGGRRQDQERSALYCMKLIECVLEKETTFIASLRSQNSPVLATPLEELLLNINPSTAIADYPYKIARYMAMNNIIPETASTVVRILRLICQAPVMQAEIVGILSSKKTESQALLVGFCEYLENDIPEETSKDTEDDCDDDEKTQESESAVRNAIRQGIVNLMISTLHQPSPNVAQFLLGFELHRSISKTVIQDAGVGMFPKTCFHSIISLLNRGIDSPRGPSCVYDTPKLSELLYQLVYFLCAHPETGTPSQRYLRTNHDFFVAHASRLPFVKKELLDDGDNELFIVLSNQQSWLLKTIAIELKMASQTRLRSSMLRILNVLYSQQTSQPGGLLEPFARLNPSQTITDTSTMLTQSGRSFTRGLRDDDGARNLVSFILSDLELAQDYPTPLTSNMFDLSAIEQLISSCEEKSDETGVIVCDIKMLHLTIMSELNSTQGMAAMGQRPEILKEVKNILRHAVERNTIRQALSAKRHAFEAWRQAVETTFAVCQYDVFPAEAREVVVLDLLQEALSKVADDAAIPELISPVAGAILMMLTHYHGSVLQRESERQSGLPSAGIDMAPLLTIFQGIINCLSKSGSSHWKTRCSLYGAILYYMQIGKQQSVVSEEDSIFGKQAKESWEASTLSFLSHHGEAFMDMVCNDACDGPEIGKMLAFAVLDSLVSIDWQGRWTSFLSSRGYLRYLVESIANDDVALQSIFLSDSDAVKTVYTFESKMGFLTKFAQSELGAQLLLQSSLTTRLAECEVLSHRPDDIANMGMQLSKLAYSMSYEPLCPTKIEQYRIIFTAVCKLIQALISSLGRKHKDSVLQVREIVMAHEDTFLGIMQSKVLHRSAVGLQELALVTSLVSLFSIKGDSDALESVTDESKAARAFLARVQRLMLGLMQTFSSKDYCDKILKDCLEDKLDPEETSRHIPADDEVTSANIKRVLLQVRLNLFSYARSIVSSSGLSGAYFHVLFSPNLVDKSSGKRFITDSKLRPDNSSISMSILVEELDNLSVELMSAVNTHNKLCRKTENIADMSVEETNQLLAQNTDQDIDRLSTQQRKLIAQKVLQKLIDLNDDQACLNIQIIENISYILWRHIEYYFIHCDPIENDKFQMDLPKAPTVRARRLQDVSLQLDSSFGAKTKNSSFINMGKYSVTKDEIRQLQIEAKSVLTDKLMKKIVETETVYGKTRSRIGFISAMVRRIQGLVKLHGS